MFLLVILGTHLELIAEVGGDATVFYSTHILDDVERVSDSVVMINHGAVVAQGPLMEILEPNGRDYVVVTRGEKDDFSERLSHEAWVTRFAARRRGSVDHWRIHTEDDPDAGDIAASFAPPPPSGGVVRAQTYAAP